MQLTFSFLLSKPVSCHRRYQPVRVSGSGPSPVQLMDGDWLYSQQIAQIFSYEEIQLLSADGNRGNHELAARMLDQNRRLAGLLRRRDIVKWLHLQSDIKAA